jgi:hypothetical protein
MSVMIELSCSGCMDATIRVGPLRKRFHGTRGEWGWGSASVDSIEDLTPEGWVMFDPYTYCTYCPSCWAGIQGDVEKEPAHA